MITGTLVVAVMLICIAWQAHLTDKQDTKQRVIARVVEWDVPLCGM